MKIQKDKQSEMVIEPQKYRKIEEIAANVDKNINQSSVENYNF